MKTSITRTAAALGGAALLASGLTLAATPAQADRTCTGTISNATVRGDVKVPEGRSCYLSNVVVRGNVTVGDNARIGIYKGRVTGNVQGEGTTSVRLSWATISGDVQFKDVGTALVRSHRIGGNVQFEEGSRQTVAIQGGRITGDLQGKEGLKRLSVTNAWIGGNLQHEESGQTYAIGNTVRGDLQVFKNRGAQTISRNRVSENLQCTENSPAPKGSGNIVGGSKEDQCRRL